MSAAAEVLSDLHLMLESPAEGAIVDDEIAVSGWCVSRSGERCAVRVRAQEHSLELPTGRSRPDVAATFPDIALAATSGFGGAFALPAGSWQISIDVRVGHGDWQLFGVRCVNCHTLEASNVIAEIGPNLDQLRPPKALVLDAIAKGRANGNGQMAAELYTGQDAEDVANYVAKAVGQTGK